MTVPRRRRSAPQHAAEPASGGDRTVLALILALVLTSGFVIGTTASFTASTKNKASFSTPALNRPTSASAVVKGKNIEISWSPIDRNLPRNANSGYRINRKYKGRPTNNFGGVPSCTTAEGESPNYFDNLSSTNLNSGPWPDDAVFYRSGVSTGQYHDGQFVCYQVQAVYPCPTAVMGGRVVCNEGTNPWTSLLLNPVTGSVQVGYVVSSWSFSSTATNGAPTEGEKLVFTFNQPFNASAANLPVVSTNNNNGDSICIDPVANKIYVGSANTGGKNVECSDANDLPVSVGILTPIASLPTNPDPLSSTSSREFRYRITAVDLAPGGCTTTCTTMTLTLGGLRTPAETGAPSMGNSSTQYRFQPTTTAGKLVSETDALPICTTNALAEPLSGRVDAGFCQPHALIGW